MPRSLSTAAREAMFQQEGGPRVFLAALEIAHASIQTIRVVNNMELVIYGGNTYLAAAFMITLPAEHDERPPEVRLRIDNVDRQIVEGVRLLSGPATVTLLVLLVEFGVAATLEAGPFIFTLRSVEYDAMEVVGVLAFEDILNDSFPKDSFTPGLYPGLFKATA